MKTQATRVDALKLLMDGAVALAQIEGNGVRVDMGYLDATVKKIDTDVRDLIAQMRSDRIWTIWQRRYGEKMNIGSDDQMGHIAFEDLGCPNAGYTASSFDIEGNLIEGQERYRSNEAAFVNIDLPFVKNRMRVKKWESAKSRLLSLRRETVDGLFHPSFNLHLARSYRSSSGSDREGGGEGCLVAGTMIEVVRDVAAMPNGIPIERVIKGDHVYCFDGNGQLTLQKVVAVKASGKKEVIRIHWGQSGKKGSLELTPDHRVRLSNGRYARADMLRPGDRLMAMSRCGDYIKATGHKKDQDHRFIYKTLIGPLEDGMVVHHKDKNHFNNVPSNLEKLSKSEHTRIHSVGRENPRWVNIEKFALLRLFALAKGRPVYVNAPLFTTFTTLKKKMALFGINAFAIRDRYDAHGRYISRTRLQDALRGGKNKVRIKFRLAYHKVERMLKQRGFSTKRRWANQCGSFVPHNHIVTAIEYVQDRKETYDIQTDGDHNFIANEVCVHNSTWNFQNIPKRNPEIAELIRRCFIPRPGHVLVDRDFKRIEVCVGCAYHLDPVMIKYMQGDGDMHFDMSLQLYCLEPEQVTDQIRDCVKGAFVFAQFYGDYYVHSAAGLWGYIDSLKLKTKDGVPLRKHLAANRIRSLEDFTEHVRTIEQDFWGRRFKVYGQWRKDWWDAYLRCGHFDMLTGFRVTGLGLGDEGESKRNACTNYPIQGSAFHCLLWTLTRAQHALAKNRWRSKLLGQVHDSQLGDIHEKEVDDYLALTDDLVERRLPKAWRWINVPMQIDAAVGPTGGSWFELKKWARKDNVWRPKK